MDITLTKTWHGVMLNKEILLQWKSKQESKKMDPFCRAIKAMVEIPPRLKTVGHVQREISWHIFFFQNLRTEKSMASYILRNINRLQFL